MRGPKARPLAFKTLLMTMAAGKPRPPARAPQPSAAPIEAPRTPAAHGSVAKPLVAEDERPPKPKASERAETDSLALDPSTRLSAQLAPPIAPPPIAPGEPSTQRARVSLEELIPQVLRRIAWGGDRTKGSVHLELVSGEKVTVHAEGRRVRVEVEGNDDLERRIGSRLRAAGIEVEGVR